MNEHNRLIGLWRDVVTLKRNFTEMQSATYRDLTKMKSELSLSARDMVNYCAVVETKNSFRSLAGVRIQ
jgi:rootletin